MVEWRAAQRDASWWNRPNTRILKISHVIRRGDVVAVCDRRVLLDVDVDEPAHRVPEGLRCQRPACQTYFGYADSLHAHRVEQGEADG